MTDNLPAETERDFHIFRKTLPLQVTLREIVKAVGNTEDLVCLAIGLPNSVQCYHLHRHGGEWHSVVVDSAKMDTFRSVLGDNVHALEGSALPFDDKTFGVVVVSDLPGHLQPVDEFVEECHRVLQPDGRLIVNVAREKGFSLIRPLRNLLGVSDAEEGRFACYSESDLFRVLKNGFNVHHMRSYSRFWVEFVDTLTRFMARKAERRKSGNEKKVKRVYSVAGIFFDLARQLDMLLFMTRGYNLIATAVRRSWRPRKTPVMTDGRTITEAVLSKPGR